MYILIIFFGSLLSGMAILKYYISIPIPSASVTSALQLDPPPHPKRADVILEHSSIFTILRTQQNYLFVQNMLEWTKSLFRPSSFPLRLSVCVQTLNPNPSERGGGTRVLNIL